MDAPADEDKPKPKPADQDQDEAAAASPQPTGGELGKQLTPDEQMAAFERAMKEEDWGHQPC